MKKTLVTLTAAAGMALASYGQGYVFFDASSAPGLVWINGVVDTTVDINAALVNPATGQTVATLLLSDGTAAGDITAYGDGHLYDLSGQSYYVGTGNPTSAPGGSANLVVECWLGEFSSYATAMAAGNLGAVSQPFSVSLAAFGSPVGSLDNFPGLIPVIPEPSTLTLAGLGAAALLFIRRRK